MQLINAGILEVLLQLHQLTGNLGLAILAFTFIVRSLLLPLSLPAIKSQKQIKALQPELDELKKKHKEDKKALQMAQIELYKKYNINPLSGCIPQIVQIIILIVLYHVMTSFVAQTEIRGITLNSNFLWMNLSQKDTTYILPILAGLTQLILSVMILPGGEVRDIVPNTSKNKQVQAENKKEEDVAEMANMMQKQMLFIMPVMTGFLAIQFPSGLGLYWVATTIYSIGQQYFFTGLGGLKTYFLRAKLLLGGQK